MEVRQVVEIVALVMVALAGVVLGWALRGDPAVNPAADKKAPEPPEPPVLDSLGLPNARSHREETVVERVVAYRQMYATETFIDSPTRPIQTRVSRPKPYWYGGGRHRAAGETLCRVTAYTDEVPTVEAPLLDWSSHPTAQWPAQLPQQDGVR